MSSVVRADPFTGTNFSLGSYEKFQSALIPRWEKAKDPRGGFWRKIRETKQIKQNTKNLTFATTIALANLKAV